MSFFHTCIQKLTYRTEVLDEAQLSPDDKPKMKALLNLHDAVEFMSSEESEHNEEGTSGLPVTKVHQATTLGEVEVKKHQGCS